MLAKSFFGRCNAFGLCLSAVNKDQPDRKARSLPAVHVSRHLNHIADIVPVIKVVKKHPVRTFKHARIGVFIVAADHDSRFAVIGHRLQGPDPHKVFQLGDVVEPVNDRLFNRSEWRVGNDGLLRSGQFTKWAGGVPVP